MKNLKTEEDVLNFIQEGQKSILKLHKDVNADYIDKISNNISQRREFYKTLTSLTLIIIGFTPFLYENGSVKQPILFYVGVTFLVLLIVLVVNYMRSILDAEGNEFSRQLKEYNLILYPFMEKRRKFIERGIFTIDALGDYLEDMKPLSMSSINLLKSRDRSARQQRKNERLDYAGEFFVFFFVIGIIFLLLSLSNTMLSASYCLVLIFFVICVIFFVPFHEIFIYLGKPIDFLKKYSKNICKNSK